MIEPCQPSILKRPTRSEDTPPPDSHSKHSSLLARKFYSSLHNTLLCPARPAMQYVRSISGSVSKTWNSINPATLSGAIDVIVVEQEDGTLACSPFHVRFGKFSLLRPYEEKVEFQVHGVKQDYAMKLGEGGEAFFVFETSDNIPEAMQTSPLVSPASSPPLPAEGTSASNLMEPDFLDLDVNTGKPRSRSTSVTRPGASVLATAAPRRQSNLSKATSNDATRPC